VGFLLSERRKPLVFSDWQNSYYFWGEIMTQLSPTAQAVIAKISASDCIARGDVYYGMVAAAAIRELVEQTLPEEPNWADSDYDHEVWNMMQSLRAQQLAVAAELEGEG